MTVPLTALIVAGGQSSRMGEDKALVDFAGTSMLDHMILLAKQAGAGRIVVLGRPDHDLGIEDTEQFVGPARAITNWLAGQPTPQRLLVLPVDMPLLSPDHLRDLSAHEPGAYFDDLYLPFVATVPADFVFDGVRMRSLLAALRLKKLAVPQEDKDRLININDPQTLKMAAEKFKALKSPG